MLYVRLCFDKPNSGALRERLRPEHRAYLRSGAIKLVQAGPLCVGDTDSTNLASFMVVEADSRDQVLRFHENDPFTMGGLYGDVHIYRWDKHFG
jgi:uncharacterized protein YciI